MATILFLKKSWIFERQFTFTDGLNIYEKAGRIRPFERGTNSSIKSNEVITGELSFNVPRFALEREPLLDYKEGLVVLKLK